MAQRLVTIGLVLMLLSGCSVLVNSLPGEAMQALHVYIDPELATELTVLGVEKSPLDRAGLEMAGYRSASEAWCAAIYTYHPRGWGGQIHMGIVFFYGHKTSNTWQVDLLNTFEWAGEILPFAQQELVAPAKFLQLGCHWPLALPGVKCGLTFDLIAGILGVLGAILGAEALLNISMVLRNAVAKGLTWLFYYGSILLVPAGLVGAIILFIKVEDQNRLIVFIASAMVLYVYAKYLLKIWLDYIVFLKVDMNYRTILGLGTGLAMVAAALVLAAKPLVCGS